MAAAIRMTGTALVGTGSFGSRVVQMLDRQLSTARTYDVTELDSACDESAALVLVCWRPEPSVCERADERAHANGTPWLPVTKNGELIVVGPWVSPGEGPCYRCYAARRRQHDRDWHVTEALHTAYGRDSALGPTGFLPQHARLTAAIAADLIARAGRGEPVAGIVTAVSIVRPYLERSWLVPCHGCHRCGRALRESELGPVLGAPGRLSLHG